MLSSEPELEEDSKIKGFNSSSLRGTHQQEYSRTPGPAHYEAEICQVDRVSLGDPSFRSALDRLEGLRSRNADVPGPGMYDLEARRCRTPTARARPAPRPARRAPAFKETPGLFIATQQAARQRAGAARRAPARRMKSLLATGHAVPEDVEVCIWIGTDSTQAPVRRQKQLGKVVHPSSSFASGTRRVTSQTPGPGPDFMGIDEPRMASVPRAPFGSSSDRETIFSRSTGLREEPTAWLMNSSGQHGSWPQTWLMPGAFPKDFG
ncbi:unnamed protein product [Effrenium voratum]|uniref:Uncharacterized protein n=1 Tax=Effrenium voratum TaxID=2562239 RepID=A0AA36J233_9DINO|nr:unnamed protein product [Effrenium voratum]